MHEVGDTKIEYIAYVQGPQLPFGFIKIRLERYCCCHPYEGPICGLVMVFFLKSMNRFRVKSKSNYFTNSKVVVP